MTNKVPIFKNKASILKNIAIILKNQVLILKNKSLSKIERFDNKRLDYFFWSKIFIIISFLLSVS